MAARKVAQHILNTASTMVGVCMTVIGLVKIGELRTGNVWVDVYVSVDSLFFLVAAVLSYFSIRHEEDRPVVGARYERWAEAPFLAGLVIMALISLLFALEVI